jgi:hypothetical protein
MQRHKTMGYHCRIDIHIVTTRTVNTSVEEVPGVSRREP